MPKLTRGDFFESGSFTDKSASAGDYSGQTRTQIVESKIKDKKPFIVGDTDGGKKIYGISVDKKWPYKLTYSKRFGTDAEGVYTITKIFKDADFGGGAGSGGGAEDTKYTESGQCYYTSLAFNVIKRELTKADCTLENLEKAAEYVDATISLSDFNAKGPVSWFEEDTYRRTANIIYKAYSRKFTERPVYCHRGSKFMDELYKAKKVIMKTDDTPGSFSNDKWNPGDIWLSTKDLNSKPLEGKKKWAEINQLVLDYAGELDKQKTTSLLGVSLKKLQPTGGSISKYNAAKRKHNVSVKYKGFTFGKTGKFFNSSDIYFNFDVANVQLRSFSSTASWQGEIKGLAAAGGKIGGGNLNYYLEKHAGISIGYPEINPDGTLKIVKSTGMVDKSAFKKVMPAGSWKEMIGTKIDLVKMYGLYVQLNSVASGPEFPVVPFDEFIKEVKSKGGGFKFSKNMCLMFMSAFLSQKQDTRDKISTDIVRYAASNTDISSFFIKVS